MPLLASLCLLLALVTHPAPITRFATSPDGTRIAWDVTGTGPVVMLLHGGGQARRAWHDLGYVERLAREFTVITVDIRGNGESDKPTATAAYSVDHLTADLLAVADAAHASKFALWGFSYGANVGRYLASRSDRVSAMVYIGIPFGEAATGPFRQYILDTRAKWDPLAAKANAGTLDVATLSEPDRATWQRGTVQVSLAWMTAMLDWPSVEPREMRCPTLWVVGTANPGAIDSAKSYESSLSGTKVTVTYLPGLTHQQEQERLDAVLPSELAFTRSHTGGR